MNDEMNFKKSTDSIRQSENPREIAQVLFAQKPSSKKTKSLLGGDIKAPRPTRRFEPYDPDARDGDGDGIVQDGTPWERPAGTRILDVLGNELERGFAGDILPTGSRIVDADGNEVAYKPKADREKTPEGAAEDVIAGPQPRMETLKDRGLQPVTEIVNPPPPAQPEQRSVQPEAPKPPSEPDVPKKAKRVDVRRIRRTYYHGTRSKDNEESIMRDGLIPNLPGDGFVEDDRGEAVYVTGDLDDALGWAGEDGLVFAVQISPMELDYDPSTGHDYTPDTISPDRVRPITDLDAERRRKRREDRELENPDITADWKPPTENDLAEPNSIESFAPRGVVYRFEPADRPADAPRGVWYFSPDPEYAKLYGNRGEVTDQLPADPLDIRNPEDRKAMRASVESILTKLDNLAESAEPANAAAYRKDRREVERALERGDSDEAIGQQIATLSIAANRLLNPENPFAPGTGVRLVLDDMKRDAMIDIESDGTYSIAFRRKPRTVPYESEPLANMDLGDSTGADVPEWLARLDQDEWPEFADWLNKLAAEGEGWEDEERRLERLDQFEEFFGRDGRKLIEGWYEAFDGQGMDAIRYGIEDSLSPEQAALLDMIAGSPPARKALYRGLRLDPEELVRAQQVGERFSLPLDAFSTSEKSASEYAGGRDLMGYPGGVIFKLEVGEKAFPMAMFSPIDEHEYLVSGQFEVVEVSEMDVGGVRPRPLITLRRVDPKQASADVPVLSSDMPQSASNYSKWAPRDEPGVTVGGVTTASLLDALGPADSKRLKVLANSQAVSSNEKQMAELRELKTRTLMSIGEQLGFSDTEIADAVEELSLFELDWYTSGGRKPIRDSGEAAWQALRDGKVPETPMERAIALQKAYTDMIWDLRYGPDEKVTLIRGVRDDYAARILLAEEMGVDWRMDTFPLTSWSLSSKGRPSVLSWVDRNGRTQKVLLETEVSRKDTLAMYHAEAEARDPYLRVKAEYIIAGGTSDKLSIVESGYGDRWDKNRSERSLRLAREEIEQSGVDLDGYWLNKDKHVTSRLEFPSYTTPDRDEMGDMDRIRPHWRVLGFEEVPKAWIEPVRFRDLQLNAANFAERARVIQSRGLTFDQVSNLLHLWDMYRNAHEIYPEEADGRRKNLEIARAALGITLPLPELPKLTEDVL